MQDHHRSRRKVRDGFLDNSDKRKGRSGQPVTGGLKAKSKRWTLSFHWTDLYLAFTQALCFACCNHIKNSKSTFHQYILKERKPAVPKLIPTENKVKKICGLLGKGDRCRTCQGQTLQLSEASAILLQSSSASPKLQTFESFFPREGLFGSSIQSCEC